MTSPKKAPPTKLRAAQALVQQHQRIRLQHSRRGSARAHEVRYEHYDVEGVMLLDFEEFIAFVPKHMRKLHPPHKLRHLFEAAAHSKAEPKLSLNEFFDWTMSPIAVREHGAISLADAFSRFDTKPSYLGRDGMLDTEEFAHVCEAMGFADDADSIFASLDKDMSGEVGYAELREAIAREGCSDISFEAKRMLITLAWSDVPGETEWARFDHLDEVAGEAVAAAKPTYSADRALKDYAASWKITGHDVHSAAALREAEAEEVRRVEAAHEASKGLDIKSAKAAKRAEIEAVRRRREAERVHRRANELKVPRQSHAQRDRPQPSFRAQCAAETAARCVCGRCARSSSTISS